jgi:uroporphyrinogen-III decarboxylase
MENFGDTPLVFYGGVSTQQALRTGGRREIEAEVRDCLSTLGKKGRWIMSTGISITSDTEMERVEILLDTYNSLRNEAGI